MNKHTEIKVEAFRVKKFCEITVQIFGSKTIISFSRLKVNKYRKIPKISLGAYIFQRPFLRGLFLEGPIFGGAYVRREICVSNSIGLACNGKEIYHFVLFFFVFGGKFQVQAPWGAYIRRGDKTEGFLRYHFGGLYLEGLIFGILR